MAIGVDRSSATRWKVTKSMPSYKTLIKMAEYFRVPLSALTSEEPVTEGDIKLTVQEKRLIYAWREASMRDKQLVAHLLEIYGQDIMGEKKEA